MLAFSLLLGTLARGEQNNSDYGNLYVQPYDNPKHQIAKPQNPSITARYTPRGLRWHRATCKRPSAEGI